MLTSVFVFRGSAAVLLFLLLFYLTPVATADTVLPSYDRVRVFQSPRALSDPELTDQDGRPFRFSEMHGRVVLVFFGFTNCPDICPTTMAKFGQLQQSGNVEPEKIAYVLVGVDAERDTSAALKAYLEQFSSEFIGLTGEPAKLKALAKDFSASYFKGSLEENGEDYSMAHSQQVFVLDTAGRLRAEFYSPSIEAMTGITLALLSEENQTPEMAP